MKKLLQSPLVRALGVFAVAALVAGAVGGTANSETRAATVDERYPPFRMSYVTMNNSYGPVTTELTWLGEGSWEKVTIASPGWEELEGSSLSYEDGTLTSYSTITGRTAREPSCSPDEGYIDRAGVLPERWFFPKIYTAEYGWETLGRNADGYDQFQRGTVIYKVRPDTWLVMEIGNVEGDEYVVEMRVTAFEILTEFNPIGN